VLEAAQVRQVVGWLKMLYGSVLALANMQILDLVAPRREHLLLSEPKDPQEERKHSHPL
jgi:hypothetical protein